VREKGLKTQITCEAKQGTAYIRIIDLISESSEASAAHVRTQVDSFLSQGIKDAEVYVNSRGGSVLEGIEIVNALSSFDNVTIKVGALAASAATYLTACFYTVAKSTSQFMFHRPRLATYGDVNMIEADLKLLRNTTDEYKQRYAKKTGKTPEEIEALWNNGDLWLNASEALHHGFINAIEDTQGTEVTALDLEILTACGAPVIPVLSPEIIDQSMNQMEKKEIISALGLPADATDEQIIAAAKEAKKKAEQHDQAQEDQEATLSARAEKLINQAVKDKKITAAHKDRYIRLAVADYDNTSAILEAMAAPQKLSASLKRSEGAGEDRKGWTLEDYLEKAPEVYAQMKEDEPEQAAALEADYFKL
jgi:ATP-dependent Clp protease protease subunit